MKQPYFGCCAFRNGKVGARHQPRGHWKITGEKLVFSAHFPFTRYCFPLEPKHRGPEKTAALPAVDSYYVNSISYAASSVVCISNSLTHRFPISKKIKKIKKGKEITSLSTRNLMTGFTHLPWRPGSCYFPS